MYRILVRISSLLLCGCLFLSQLASAQSVQLTSELETINPAPLMSFVLDPEDRLSLEDVQNLQFTPLENDAIDFGFTSDKIWLRFSVSNASDENINPLLRTSARFMRPLEIYLVRENESYQQLLYNDETLNFHDRPIPELRFLATEFELAGNERAEFFVKFGAGGQATMTIEIGDRESALVEQWQSNVWAILFVAVLSTLILVNFFHYVAVRHLAYLVYVVYESLNMLYITHMDGHTFQFLWPNLPQWNDDATPMLAASALIGGSFFVMVFLETRKYSPFMHKGFIFIAVYSSAALLITVFLGNRVGNLLTAPMLPIGVLFSVVAAVIALRKGHYLARYFIVAWSLFLISGVIWSGSILGLMSFDLNILAVHKTTVAIQAVILSMGLADQVRRINEEFATTQAELINNLEGRLEDTRERLQLERKNEEAMEQLLDKSKQIATASHDINQPIQSLRLALKALQTQSSDQSTEHLEKTLDHMESVLGGALDKASDELKESTEHAPIQSLVAGSLLSEVADHFRELAVENSITLKSFSSNAVVVTRELPLKRCLMNLVSNAINHASTDRILLGTRRNGESILFQVIDAGEGISRDQADLLQSPLNKGIDSKGHGLGLAIIRELCAEYGWQFTINSVLGKGSCFTISVPVRA